MSLVEALVDSDLTNGDSSTTDLTTIANTAAKYSTSTTTTDVAVNNSTSTARFTDVASGKPSCKKRRTKDEHFLSDYQDNPNEAVSYYC